MVKSNFIAGGFIKLLRLFFLDRVLLLIRFFWFIFVTLLVFFVIHLLSRWIHVLRLGLVFTRRGVINFILIIVSGGIVEVHFHRGFLIARNELLNDDLFRSRLRILFFELNGARLMLRNR